MNDNEIVATRGLPECLVRDVAAFREAYARDGVVHIPGALSPADLATARALFDWSRTHKSQSAWDVELGGPGETIFIDTHNPDARSLYVDRLKGSTLPAIAAAVLGTDRLWFLGEQLFVKRGEPGTRSTPWHQDSDLPIDETGCMAMWIALDRLDPEFCLKFVRGSHRGPEFNPQIAAPDGNGLRPLYPDATHMLPFPDIAANPSAFDIVSWPCEPGDVILFHTMTIHGDGPVPPAGTRDTLCARFVDARVKYKARPRRESNGNLAAEAVDYLWEGLREGMPVHRGVHFSPVLEKPNSG